MLWIGCSNVVATNTSPTPGSSSARFSLTETRFLQRVRQIDDGVVGDVLSETHA